MRWTDHRILHSDRAVEDTRSIDAASIGRPILAATKEGDTPGLLAMTWPFRWITLVRLIRVARLTNTTACGAGKTMTATAGAVMSEARTNTQTRRRY